jgi:hypothetical protein
MNKRKSSPRQDDLDAKAIEAALDAQSRHCSYQRERPGRYRRSHRVHGGWPVLT